MAHLVDGSFCLLNQVSHKSDLQESVAVARLKVARLFGRLEFRGRSVEDCFG